MPNKEIYILNKGDIVWIDFDPSSGQEMQKRRPRFFSPDDFNRKACFAVICPITFTIKDLSTRYSRPTKGDINGQVIIFCYHQAIYLN